MEKKFSLSQPKYNVTLLSGKSCSFRPMNIREEKSLLLAKQTNDRESILKTLIEIMNSCFDDKILNYTTYDFENAFLQLRAKSIGEEEQFNLNCPETKEKILVKINLENDLEKIDKKPNSKIKISEEILIKFREPTVKDILKYPKYSIDSEQFNNLIIDCILEIQQGKENISKEELSTKQLKSTIDNLSPKQYKEILNYFNSLPSIKVFIKYKTSDQIQREIKIKGIFNFISFFLII